jgi:hypothetical protein
MIRCLVGVSFAGEFSQVKSQSFLQVQHFTAAYRCLNHHINDHNQVVATFSKESEQPSLSNINLLSALPS